MEMVMPRAFSSGAESMESKGRNSASPLSDSTLVMAAVRVVLPWSMCPIVPTLTCGLVLSNFFLAMLKPLQFMMYPVKEHRDRCKAGLHAQQISFLFQSHLAGRAQSIERQTTDY